MDKACESYNTRRADQMSMQKMAVAAAFSDKASRAMNLLINKLDGTDPEDRKEPE